MANTTITNLPVATTLTGAAVVPVVQGGVTYQATAGQIAGLYNGAATSLPAATTSQLYGGTGAAGVAQPVSVGTGLTLNPTTHTLALTTPPSVASYVRSSFTATAGQTVFSVTYTVGLAQVYVNGVLLNSVDYTANNGTSVVLNVACLIGDLVEVIAFNNATGFLANIGPTGVLGVAGGGTGVTTSTGSGSVVLSNSPTMATPAASDYFNSTNVSFAGPSVSTRSLGTRAVYYPSLSSTSYDYAVGLSASGQIWSSVGSGGAGFGWYDARKSSAIAQLYYEPFYGNSTLQSDFFDASSNRGSGNTAPWFSALGAMSGVKTGGQPALMYLNTTSDTMNAGGGGLGLAFFTQNAGGADCVGNRVTVYSTLNYTGGPTNKSLGIEPQASAFYCYANVGGNVGGTSSATWGSVWGAVISGQLTATASWWAYNIGLEIDFGNLGTTACSYMQGAKIVLFNGTNQPVQSTDYFLALTSGDATGNLVGTGISFGSPDGFWAWDTTSILINANILPNGGLPGYPGPTRVAKTGIDFSAVTFSMGFLKSTGFLVDGIGNITTSGYLAPKKPNIVTTTTYSVTTADSSLIFNCSATCTVTLPSAVTYPGRILWVRTIAAFSVNSATSNVAPVTSGTAGTAILAATAGKWAALQSDGTIWQTMESN